MTREEFDGLVQRLETVSRRNPGLYRVRLAGLVALAYAYLLLILLGSLALCLLMVAMVIYQPVTLKLAIIGLLAFGGIFLAVLRGLWVRLEPPKGLPVTRAQAPQLFALLDELRGALNCRPFHQVLIVGDLNAGVVQVPRLGVFGWHRSYLVLGLPLLQSLGPAEFKAVLAHEFTHSSRGHGYFGNWLYRVRRTWEQVFQQMIAQRSRLGFALFKFVNWYWPIFNGHAFVLARANEYEADAWSVRLAGADAAAGALVRTRVEGALLAEKFWPGVFARANQDPAPPANIVLDLGTALKTGPAADEAARWLRHALLEETNNVDTHPCLKDRLRAIGQLPVEVENGRFPAPPLPPPQSAADFFLGPHAGIVARQMSEDWCRSVAQQWTVRHEHAQKLAGELAALEKPATVPPAAAQIWEKACKLIELHGDSAAIPALEQIVALDPKHAGANFVLGRHYLQLDDPRGVGFVETALAADPTLAQAGCNLLYAHFTRTGQRGQLRPLEHRFDDLQQEAQLAQQERANIRAADTFVPGELTAEQAAELRKIFLSEPEIGLAAVARKQVAHQPGSPCYVVALKIKAPWWKARGQQVNGLLVRRVLQQVHLPGHFMVFVSEKNLKALGAKVFAVPGAVLYERVQS